MELAMDFQAGAFQVNITPPLGTLINGDFVSHYTRNIHDQLFAKALVFKDASQTIAFLVVDICLMDKEFIDEIKVECYEQFDILPSNLLVSATHTHAAGSIMSILLGAADLPYRQSLKSLLVQAVYGALAKLEPSKIAFGSVAAPEYVLCRRYYMKAGYDKSNIITGLQDSVKTNPFGGESYIEKPSGITDPEMAFIAVMSLSGEWISILANYSLHYVGDWENGTISADYFGFFASRLTNNLKAGKNFVGIMSNGTSGDINVWDFQNPERFPKENFKKSELIGYDLADKLTNSIENLEWESNPELEVKYTELPLRVRKPTDGELLAAEDIVRNTDFSNFSIKNPYALKQLYAREQVFLGRYPEAIKMPLQVFRVGSVRIGGIASEFFASTGIKLKELSEDGKYFTITMANGIFGYVPPPAEMDKGGYESWRSRNSYLERSAEELVVETLEKYIKPVK